MKIISIKNQPEFKDTAIKYFQSKWASPDTMKVYEDCIEHCFDTKY